VRQLEIKVLNLITACEVAVETEKHLLLHRFF